MLTLLSQFIPSAGNKGFPGFGFAWKGRLSTINSEIELALPPFSF
jgi:hypothetical protein